MLKSLQFKGIGRPDVKTQKANVPDEKKPELASAPPGDWGSVVSKVQRQSLSLDG